VIHIVLYEPEIPGNTGNIMRTCVATGTKLHLIEPLGFRLNEKEIKRAGMDYWEHLDVTRYVNFEDFLEKNPIDWDKNEIRCISLEKSPGSYRFRRAVRTKVAILVKNRKGRSFLP